MKKQFLYLFTALLMLSACEKNSNVVAPQAAATSFHADRHDARIDSIIAEQNKKADMSQARKINDKKVKYTPATPACITPAIDGEPYTSTNWYQEFVISAPLDADTTIDVTVTVNGQSVVITKSFSDYKSYLLFPVTPTYNEVAYLNSFELPDAFLDGGFSNTLYLIKPGDIMTVTVCGKSADFKVQ